MQVDTHEYTVVWAGKEPLLPEREERMDVRLYAMPSYDLDEFTGAAGRVSSLVRFGAGVERLKNAKRRYVMGKRG